MMVVGIFFCILFGNNILGLMWFSFKFVFGFINILMELSLKEEDCFLFCYILMLICF